MPSEPLIPPALIRLHRAQEEGALTPAAAANVEKWLTGSGYAAYRPRLTAMIEAGKFAELEQLFWEVIPFGTGGRRGPMAELGSATLNARTVAESASGVANYYHSLDGRPQGRAVVACDTRNRSTEFARVAASVLAGHGFRVYLFDGPRATPELSFAVRHLGCDVGLMISASHNPPIDNGVKVYWSHGGQVLAPHDRGIIDEVYRINEIPAAPFDEAVADGRIEIVGEAIDALYVEEVARLRLSSARGVTILFSPLHGVGESAVARGLAAAGFDDLEIYEPHRAPDGNFTNVPQNLPNPELPSVFEPLEARARELGADLVMASDPDADRIGALVRLAGGEYRYLDGNRLGVLIVDYVCRKRAAQGRLGSEDYVVTTLVTSPLGGAIAREYGLRVIDDLPVGFKYIGEVVERDGPDHFVLGYEESHGYLAGNYARDKDASVGALYLAEAAAESKQAGQSLVDRLRELWARHGYHRERQHSQTCPGPDGQERIGRLMERLRTAPPTELGGLPLTRVVDYQTGEVRDLPANVRADEIVGWKGDLLFFTAGNDRLELRVAARPSGTEPKIKFYLFARASAAAGESLDALIEATDDRLERFRRDLAAWLSRAD